jgi:hypothetical protein
MEQVIKAVRVGGKEYDWAEWWLGGYFYEWFMAWSLGD